MANSTSSVALVSDLVDLAQANQGLAQRKANTVTVAIGSVLTALAAGGTFWIESGSDAPSWLPLVVFIIGQLVTVVATSQTRNGVTDSVKDKINTELVKRIDLHHEPAVDAVEQAADDLDELRRRAESFTQNLR